MSDEKIKPAEVDEDAAHDAELKRQADVEKAVKKANDAELAKLGGPLLEPGLGR